MPLRHPRLVAATSRCGSMNYRAAQYRRGLPRHDAPQPDARGIVPCGAGLDRGGDPLRERVVEGDAFLEMERFHLEDAVASMGLGIEAADEPVANEDRQGEVAVAPLRRRRVALDAVIEPKEREGALPVPDDRVEGREESRVRRTAAAADGGQRRTMVAMEKGVAGHAFDTRRKELAVVDERLDRGRRLGEAHAVVVRGPAGGGDAERTHGIGDERAMRCRGRGKAGGGPSGKNTLAQVVHPLVALPPRDHELTGAEELFEIALLRPPPPPSATP